MHLTDSPSVPSSPIPDGDNRPDIYHHSAVQREFSYGGTYLDGVDIVPVVVRQLTPHPILVRHLLDILNPESARKRTVTEGPHRDGPHCFRHYP